MASSAYQACFTVRVLDCRWSISGLTARAYIAMARGSPCVVPSDEDISPLPGITHLMGGGLVCVVQNERQRWADDTDVM